MDFAASQPVFFYSGADVKWSRSFASFPADDSWTSKYYLLNNSHRAEIDLIQDPNNLSAFQLALDATESAAIPAGEYQYQYLCEKTGEKYVAETGRQKVIATLESATGPTDTRPFEVRALEALEGVIEGKANMDQLSMSISGRSISRMSWSEILAAYDRFKTAVAQLDEAAGLSNRSTLLVDFTPRWS